MRAWLHQLLHKSGEGPSTLSRKATSETGYNQNGMHEEIRMQCKYCICDIYFRRTASNMNLNLRKGRNQMHATTASFCPSARVYNVARETFAIRLNTCYHCYLLLHQLPLRNQISQQLQLPLRRQWLVNLMALHLPKMCVLIPKSGSS